MMKRVLLLLVALAARAGAVEGSEPVVEPKADQTLRQMSDYLGHLRTFRVQAQAIDEAVTVEGQKLQFASESRLAVQRPNRLHDERIGPNAHVEFVYDGNSFNLLGKRIGYYAIAPAPPTLDSAVEAARARYGIDAPAADLLLSRPYDALMEGVQTGRYVGLEPIEGVMCHHLAYTGKETDWQIWVQDGPQPLPRRYAITTKDLPAQPEFQVNLSRWEPNAPLPASLFTFTPPPGGKRIELAPVGKYQSNR
jgi:hypothetical protein